MFCNKDHGLYVVIILKSQAAILLFRNLFISCLQYSSWSYVCINNKKVELQNRHISRQLNV